MNVILIILACYVGIGLIVAAPASYLTRKWQWKQVLVWPVIFYFIIFGISEARAVQKERDARKE